MVCKFDPLIIDNEYQRPKYYYCLLIYYILVGGKQSSDFGELGIVSKEIIPRNVYVTWRRRRVMVVINSTSIMLSRKKTKQESRELQHTKNHRQKINKKDSLHVPTAKEICTGLQLQKAPWWGCQQLREELRKSREREREREIEQAILLQ